MLRNTVKTPDGLRANFAETAQLITSTNARIDGISLSWSDITGKPTTVSGFGITDAGTFSSGSGSPGGGVTSQFYVDTSNGRLYWKVGASWYYTVGVLLVS